MIKMLSVVIALFFLVNNGNGQQAGDRIIGERLTGDKSGIISVYKQGDKYFGKIIGGNSGKTKDVKNDDPKLRNRDLIGLVILTDFVFEEGAWSKGKIYDPNSGNTYKCLIKMKSNDTIEVKGYVGFSLLGRTEVWTRIRK